MTTRETGLDERVKSMSFVPGEKITRILEFISTFSDGATIIDITRRSKSWRGLNEWFGFLNMYQLLSKEDERFHTTDFYNRLDKEALPYALDTVFTEDLLDPALEPPKRTGHLMRKHILDELSEYGPQYISVFSVDLGDSNAKQHLIGLESDEYISPVQKENRVVYQITPPGINLLERINQCVDQLRQVYTPDNSIK
jgi:predicted transcriptional regulator